MKLREITAVAALFLLACIPAISAKPLDVSMSSGFARIDAPGITIRNGKPGAIVAIDKIHIPILVTSPGRIINETKVQTFLGSALERRYRWDNPRNFALIWTVTVLDSGDGVMFKTSIYNGTGAPAYIQELTMLDTGAEAVRYSGAKTNWYISTLADIDQIGSLATPARAQAVHGISLASPEVRTFSDFMAFYRDGGATGFALGPVGKPEADVRIECQTGGKRAGLTATSEMSEVLLEPGCWRDSQEILLLARPYHEATTGILQWITATHGHRNHRGVAAGWRSGSSSTEQQCETAALLCNNRPANSCKLDVLQVDEGYEIAPGNWTCNTRFPNGLARFVNLTTNSGAAAGIWVAPLVVSDTTGLAEEHPDWFQKLADGTVIPGPTVGKNHCNLLDPTSPGAREFLKKTLLDLKSQGFGYFKIDLNEVDSRAHFSDPTKTRLQVLRALHELYRATLGEDAYIVSTTGLFRGAAGFVDALRMGISSSPESSATNWSGLHDCIIHAGYASTANGILYAIDPDVTHLMPHNKLTSDEWQTWHSFVGLMGGEVFVSEPLENSPELARNLEILTPQAPEKAWSFSGATDREHRRFGFAARRPYGDFVSMLVWNPLEASAEEPIAGQGVNQLGKQFHIWSYWDEKYWGVGDASYVFKGINPHSCKVLRLTPIAPDQPVVIGSTLHLSMGAAEIADFSADAKNVTIKLTVAGARDGKLVLASRKALQVTATDHCVVSAVRERSTGIWEVIVSSRDRSQEQRIQLAITE